MKANFPVNQIPKNSIYKISPYFGFLINLLVLWTSSSRLDVEYLKNIEHVGYSGLFWVYLTYLEVTGVIAKNQRIVKGRRTSERAWICQTVWRRTQEYSSGSRETRVFQCAEVIQEASFWWCAGKLVLTVRLSNKKMHCKNVFSLD